MEARRIANTCIKVMMPLLLGGAILYWMYRGFDFEGMKDVLLHGMDWTWMALSFPFGILAQMLRGWRWRQTLEPVGERPRASVSVYSIFLSYAASLVVPRIGEFTRCGVLRRYDGVSFPKALGTVVAERAIDSLVVLVVTGESVAKSRHIAKLASDLNPGLPVIVRTEHFDSEEAFADLSNVTVVSDTIATSFCLAAAAADAEDVAGFAFEVLAARQVAGATLQQGDRCKAAAQMLASLGQDDARQGVYDPTPLLDHPDRMTDTVTGLSAPTTAVVLMDCARSLIAAAHDTRADQTSQTEPTPTDEAWRAYAVQAANHVLQAFRLGYPMIDEALFDAEATTNRNSG